MRNLEPEVQTYRELANLLWYEARTTGSPDTGFHSKMKPFLKSGADVICIMLTDYQENGMDYQGHFLIKVIGDTKHIFGQEEYITTTRCHNELTKLLMQMADEAVAKACALNVAVKALYFTEPQLNQPHFSQVALNVAENMYKGRAGFVDAVKDAIIKDFCISESKATAILETVTEESFNNQISVIQNAYLAAQVVSKNCSKQTFREVQNDAVKQLFVPKADEAGEFVCAIDLLLSQSGEDVKQRFEQIGWSEDMKGFLLRALKQYQRQVSSSSQLLWIH